MRSITSFTVCVPPCNLMVSDSPSKLYWPNLVAILERHFEKPLTSYSGIGSRPPAAQQTTLLMVLLMQICDCHLANQDFHTFRLEISDIQFGVSTIGAMDTLTQSVCEPYCRHGEHLDSFSNASSSQCCLVLSSSFGGGIHCRFRSVLADVQLEC